METNCHIQLFRPNWRCVGLSCGYQTSQSSSSLKL